MATGCSAVFFLGQDGTAIISRNYRGDVPMFAVRRFKQLLRDQDSSAMKPVLEEEDISYAHIRHENLILLAVSSRNANAAILLIFLQRCITVLEQYINIVLEESVRDNFVLVYELLDEMMDYGYPQITDPEHLRCSVTQDGERFQRTAPVIDVVDPIIFCGVPPPKYRRNEIFLDVTERVSLKYTHSGHLMDIEIRGAVSGKALLSGVPEVKIAFNERIYLSDRSDPWQDDIILHPCIRRAAVKSNVLSFIPPDNTCFDLLQYRCSLPCHMSPPVEVKSAIVSRSATKLVFNVRVSAKIPPRFTARDISVKVPLPADATSPVMDCTVGRSVYTPESDSLVWTISSLTGEASASMRVTLLLPSIARDAKEKLPPLAVQFEIPHFAVSGIRVRYVKVIAMQAYKAYPWVRYLTRSEVCEGGVPW